MNLIKGLDNCSFSEVKRKVKAFYEKIYIETMLYLEKVSSNISSNINEMTVTLFRHESSTCFSLLSQNFTSSLREHRTMIFSIFDWIIQLIFESILSYIKHCEAWQKIYYLNSIEFENKNWIVYNFQFRLQKDV